MVHSLANLTGRRNVVPWILNSAGRLRSSINLNPKKISLVTIILYVIISLALSTALKHYKAKLFILCIVSGTRIKPKSNLLRNKQHCYFSLIFFAVLDSLNRYLKHCTAQNPYLLNPEQFFESTNKEQDINIAKLSCWGTHNCKRNPQIVCGIRKL